jgi:N-acetylglucosaminyl-diphospho-decaprenol L-rhamnosyltransferase
MHGSMRFSLPQAPVHAQKFLELFQPGRPCDLPAAPQMSQNPHLDLSIIIVSWNVRDLLRGCLHSLLASRGVRFAGAPDPSGSSQAGAGLDEGPTVAAEIIVVDNASTDGSPAMISAAFPWVGLVANGSNRGFTAGNNQGLERSRAGYVLFLNPDTVVPQDALATMVAWMEEHPQVGGLGPELRYGDGAVQSSARRFPTLLTALFESTPIAWHWPDNPWARRFHMEDVALPLRENLSGEHESTLCLCVDWVVGAALLVRRAALEQVGGFDEGFFMYSEEVDWCRRAVDAGWHIAYLPSVQVVHYEGKSSEQVVAARHIRFHTSRVRYFRKHHGPIAAEVLRVCLLCMFAFEWVMEAAKWLAGSRRSLRQARMSAYGQLLRNGLRPTGPKSSEGKIRRQEGTL